MEKEGEEVREGEAVMEPPPGPELVAGVALVEGEDDLPNLPYTAIGGRPRERTPTRSPSQSPVRRSTPRSASRAVYSRENSPFKRPEADLELTDTEEGEAVAGNMEREEEGDGELAQFKVPHEDSENDSDESEKTKEGEGRKKAV